MKPDSDPRLPRSPQDPDNLRRLREEALRRREEEERASPATVYGGPPPPTDDRPGPPELAAVYGGPPPFNGGGSITRRLTLWGLLLLALGALGAIIARLFGRSRVITPEYLQSGPPAAVYGGPPIQPPQPPQPQPDSKQILTGALQTQNGDFLTAVNGGGLGDPKSASEGVALSTGATKAGPFETFTLVWVNKSANTFALKTYDGHFVTAVDGGGIGGPNSDQSPVHTDGSDIGPWEKFTITLLHDNIHATIGTPDGTHFLSAVKGGGVGGSNKVPVHTDATTLGAAAVFQLVTVRPHDRPPAPVYGGPPPRPPG